MGEISNIRGFKIEGVEICGHYNETYGICDFKDNEECDCEGNENECEVD